MGFPKPYRLRGIVKNELYTHKIVDVVLFFIAMTLLVAIVLGGFSIAPIRLT